MSHRVPSLECHPFYVTVKITMPSIPMSHRVPSMECHPFYVTVNITMPSIPMSLDVITIMCTSNIIDFFKCHCLIQAPILPAHVSILLLHAYELAIYTYFWNMLKQCNIIF